MILITGGAGFVGSVIAAHLESISADVVVCDRLRSGLKWRNLARRRLYHFIWPKELGEFVHRHRRSLSAVVHMAAISSTQEANADLVFRSNFHLSRKLWNFCTRHEIPFIYASSGATYGDGSQGFRDSWSPSDLSKLRPLNLYGWSKHAFDRFVSNEVVMRRMHPPKWFGFKLMNVYGPNEYHKGAMRSMVLQVYDQIIAREKVTLFKSHQQGIADGQQSRDFVYVRDCADVVIWSLQHCHASGIYNLGTGESRTFAELARAVAAAMGRHVGIEYVEMPESLRAVYQYRTQADLSSLRNANCACEFQSLNRGISEYVNSFLLVDDSYL